MNNKNLSQTTTPLKGGDLTTDARMHENMREMLEQNLKISEEVEKNTRYIKRYIIFSQIFDFFKILIILIPIILAFTYGPKFVNYIKSNPEVLFQNSVFETFANTMAEALLK